MPPHPVDYYVGRRLRSRRTMLGMSQENLGMAVGVTFQQIQKYERGLNRIGASRLYEFARILDVTVSYFFEDLANHTPTAHALQELTPHMELAEAGGTFQYEKLGNKEILTLVRSYYDIEDPQVRKKVLSLIKSLSANALEEADEPEERKKRRVKQL